MKIIPVNLISNPVLRQVNFMNSQVSFRNSCSEDTFCPNENNELEGYRVFLKEFYKTFPNKTISEVLSKISFEDDLIGSGRKSMVFKINGLDNYVVKLSACEYDYDPVWYNDPVIPCKDKYPNHNFGQPIATIGPTSKILKRVKGEENGVNNWFFKFEHSLSRTKEDALKILKDTKRIASFPQNSFNNIANDLKYLTSKGIKIDSINPNNFIIDYENKKISLVDVSDKPCSLKNTMYDILVPILDLISFDEYMELFNEKEKEQYLSSAKTIYKKLLNTQLPDSLEEDKNFRKKNTFQYEKIDRLDNIIELLKK